MHVPPSVPMTHAQCPTAPTTSLTTLDQEVVKTCNKTLIQELTTLPSDLGGPLARQSILDLHEFFNDHTQHRPSESMWEALVDLASAMEGMADGTIDPAFYLSSLDPGVGKTQTISRFIKVLVASQDHQDVGVIICVSRLSEITSLVADMDLNEEDYGVITSDKELNNSGCRDHTHGRILFTTQQMVEKRCYEQLFADTEEFNYRGQVRQVRIWDESILPGQTITLNRDDLGFLFKPLRGVHPELTDTIETIFMELRDVDDGEVFQLPDFAEGHGVDVNEVLRVLHDATAVEQAIASSLWFLSGKLVTVRRDGSYGNTVLDYRDTLPEDIAPMVVLDASGRVRRTYTAWEEGRGGLARLQSAEKSYANLRVHVWPTGGGKSAFRRQGMKLIDGIAATINTKPDEEWLVVCHKSESSFDVEATVRDLVDLGVDQDKLHFITWGNHHATNQYSKVKNVILAGTLFYRTSHYEALGRLSAARRADDGVFTQKDRRQIELGEHAHLVLQALCRGAVRVCEDGCCASCDAYIIASTKSGIEEALPTIFPDCSIMPWKPVQTILTGKVKDAVEFIDKWLEDHPGENYIPFITVRDAIGISNARNFAKNVRQHEDFIEGMAERNIIEYGEGKYPRGFLHRNAEYYGFTDEKQAVEVQQ